mgnify:CR=1 FL=1
MKEEALKLADELEALHQYVPSEAPAMIRRLVEELDKQTQLTDKYCHSWHDAVDGVLELKERLDKAQQDLKKYDELAFDDLTNLTPCEEIRRFQNVQNGVFSSHNACCYREDCRIVWNDWEKVRSSMMPLSDEEIPSLLSAQVWRELPIEIKTHLVRAIEERHGIK